jgi:hypothetical protein
MNLIIQHEYYHELQDSHLVGRNIEAEAPEAGKADEKVYE